MVDSLLTIAVVVVVGCAALGVWEVDAHSTQSTELVKRDPLTGAKEKPNIVVSERLLKPEAEAAGKSCEDLIEGLLKVSDENGYNLDWVFFVMNIFDAQLYPWGSEIEKALSAGELPLDIKPQNATTRTKAIKQVCNWVAKRCTEVVTIPPNSKNATIFKLSLESILEPFEEVTEERKNLVVKCENILNKLMEYYKRNNISYDFVFVYFLALDPRFSNYQLCTYAINIFFYRLEEENKKENRSSKWPHYNILQVSEMEKFWDKASLRLELKLRTTTVSPNN